MYIVVAAEVRKSKRGAIAYFQVMPHRGWIEWVTAERLVPVRCENAEQRAARLSQPHRAAIHALIADKLALKRLHGGFDRDRWQRHSASSFTCYAGASSKVQFGHPLEYDFACRLELAGIAWDYEPVRFRYEGGAFKPDFHLPELDMYVEITSHLGDVKTDKLLGMGSEHPDELFAVLDGDAARHALTVAPEKLGAWLMQRQQLTRERQRQLCEAA
jgi:hypothetical protein